MPSRLTGFVCPTVSMVTTSHATGMEKTLLYPGRMALNPFIASNRRYKVFPLRDTFNIGNGLLE